MELITDTLLSILKKNNDKEMTKDQLINKYKNNTEQNDGLIENNKLIERKQYLDEFYRNYIKKQMNFSVSNNVMKRVKIISSLIIFPLLLLFILFIGGASLGVFFLKLITGIATCMHLLTVGAVIIPSTDI